ncbi:hypothetical protein [Streptomyces sp. KL116D]|uniref:hypothetical protein n=1 Tax=Streptomyces sp. KL116D TaxID=3045152 RepID=UPI003559363A
MTVVDHSYDAADIEVLEFDAVVRKRPGMFFRVAPDEPQFATEVLCAVATHVLHPATRVAGEHTLRGLVEITSDSSFTLCVDQPHSWEDKGPVLGYFGSLLGPEWWLMAAAAAMCEQVTVEMWCAGRGWRQLHTGIRPLAAPQEFRPPQPHGSGTSVRFAFDRAYVGPHFVLPADHESLDLHGPYCSKPAGPGQVLIRDTRRGSGHGPQGTLHR